MLENGSVNELIKQKHNLIRDIENQVDDFEVQRRHYEIEKIERKINNTNEMLISHFNTQLAKQTKTLFKPKQKKWSGYNKYCVTCQGCIELKQLSRNTFLRIMERRSKTFEEVHESYYCKKCRKKHK